MALNVAQLMNVPGGPGVIGAVKAGANITITPDGVISAGSDASVLAGYGLTNTLDNATLKVSIQQRTGVPPVGGLPSQATVGSLYWDNTLGTMFIYYDSGSAQQWVQVAGLG